MQPSRFPARGILRSSLGLLPLIAGLAAAWPAQSLASDVEARATLRSLLEAGDVKGRLAFVEAERRFEAAKAASSDDRQAHYAYGVVLAKLLKLADAESVFAAAAKGPQGSYPQAYCAALYLQLHLRHWKSAAETALAFGEVFVKEPDAWSGDDTWAADARWLGRTVSAAQFLVSTGEDVKLWLDVDRQLRQTLPAILLTTYAEGFEETLDLRTKLAGDVAETREEAQKKLAEQQELERRKALDQQRQTAASRENLKATAATNKKAFDEQLAEYAKQLGLMEKEWNQLDERRQSVERSILLINQEMTLLQQQYQALSAQNQNSQTPSGLTRNRLQLIDQQLAQRQQQLLQYQADHGRTTTAMGVVNQRATGLLAQRQSAVADFERLTGEVQKRDEQLEKFKARLEKKVTELELPPEGNTPTVKARERKLQTISAYVPRDWEEERQRLLQEFADK